ncbi:unnamed protein product [Mytilus coruscus]|uniref:C-type lectin domain-containing protein n=1 Tax=Mytilus coruscus TaxID=42192 RepID=A0A6J8D899_MYTCO|nr:unnamed protein product [Mytilus coruscus]
MFLLDCSKTDSSCKILYAFFIFVDKQGKSRAATLILPIVHLVLISQEYRFCSIEEPSLSQGGSLMRAPENVFYLLEGDVKHVLLFWAALTCFHCHQIPFPRDCKTVVKCGDHEECFAERIETDDGNAYFNTGCRDKQRYLASQGKRVVARRQNSVEKIVCDTSCSDDHCNYGGCGADPLPAKDQRGPICYACALMKNPDQCNQVKICSRDELCEIMKTPHPLFDVTYTTKCGSKTLCDRLSGLSHTFGRSLEAVSEVNRRGFSLCFRCCSGDRCNLGCTVPNVTTTATSATTTPVATVTTPGSTIISKSTLTKNSTNHGTYKYLTRSSYKVDLQLFVCTGCLPEYIYYGASCYYFSKTSLYWESAKQFCRGHGSDLVIINDATENNLLVQHLKHLVAQHLLPSDLWGFYIGAHLVNGAWKWVDNSTVTYTDWATQEPNRPTSQIYGSIYVPSSGFYNYQWASHKDMYTTQYFICEFNPIP